MNDPGNIQTPSPLGGPNIPVVGNRTGNANGTPPNGTQPTGNIIVNQTPSPSGGSLPPNSNGRGPPLDDTNRTEFIIGNVLLIIALFLITLLIISMVIKYVRKNKDFRGAIKSKSGRPLLILLAITITAFLVAIIVTLEYTVEDLFTNSTAIAGEYFTMVSAVTICYRVGRLSMTSLFLFRLHISFKV